MNGRIPGNNLFDTRPSNILIVPENIGGAEGARTPDLYTASVYRSKGVVRDTVILIGIHSINHCYINKIFILLIYDSGRLISSDAELYLKLISYGPLFFI